MTMHAVILAAGVGNRLGALGESPKSLLSIGGQTLLSRHISALAKHPIAKLTICVGYRAEQLRLAATHPNLPIECVTNADYRRGSVVSLWTVRDALTASDEVILMDADVLYADSVLDTLIASRNPNCFLLDRDFVRGDEPVKLCVRDNALVEFRKRPDPTIRFAYCGESVGFFKFSRRCAEDLAQRCEAYVTASRLDEPYEEPIRDLVLAAAQPLAFEDISGMPWIEIDFPEDIVRAERDILPQMVRKAGQRHV